MAVVGGDLAGVTAALTIAEQQNCHVWLLTSHPHILKGIFNTDATPILPDLALENRELIDRYGSGGRELAGLLAKQCSPLQAKEWLEEQGVILQEEGSTDDMSTLLHEKPFFVSPKCNLREVLQRNLDQANIHIEANTFIKNVSFKKKEFHIEMVGRDILRADVLILADDYPDGIQAPILVAKEDDNQRKSKKDQFLSFDFDDEAPLSLKDQMLLEKKEQKYAKKQKMNDMVNDNDVNFKELSKQDQRVLAKKRKKETKKEKEQLKQKKKGTTGRTTSSESISDSVTTDAEQQETEDDSSDTEDVATAAPSLPSTTLDSLGIASKLGHTIVDTSPGMFDFLVPTSGILEGCSKAVVPKARLRCKVETPPAARKKNEKASRLPKLEGPLFMAQGEVSGPGALRLSTLIAHEMADSGHRGTLQLHFAPDIGGVEDLTKILLDTVDPNESVIKSLCPLVHREIDYDDYDVETGDFKSVEFPLVPGGLWANLCQLAGITVSKLKWKDLPPNSVQNLARLLADCPLAITGVRPNDNIMAGGVSLKELDMADCKSRMIGGLFFCGSVIDVHGFDRGFNPLVSLATGRVAGISAVKCLDKK